MIMFERGYKNLSTIVLVMLCCLVSAQAMEDREVNRARLKEDTFVFIKNYVNSRNNQPRKRMRVPARMFQHIPEKIPMLLPLSSICMINGGTAKEIAAEIGIDEITKNFALDYSAFKQDKSLTKRMCVSNYLMGCVFEDERESIDVKRKSRIDEESADQIARFLKIVT